MTESSQSSRWLVSTEWLASRLGAPDLVVVDGSYYLPAHKRDATADYVAGHIPGAVRFDVDDVSDHAQSLPHMLPSAETFAAKVGALGIGDGDSIVIYDGARACSRRRGCGGRSALFGAENVFILEGGMPKWQAERRPIEAGTVTRPPRKFTARIDPRLVAAMPKCIRARRQERASRRCAPRRPLPRRCAGAAARRAARPHAGFAQRAVHRTGRRTESCCARQDCARLSRPAALISNSRSSPVADPACPRRPCGSHSKRSARRRKRSTTAHGRNGARQRHARREAKIGRCVGSRDDIASSLSTADDARSTNYSGLFRRWRITLREVEEFDPRRGRHDLPPAVRQRLRDLHLPARQPPRRRGADHRSGAREGRSLPAARQRTRPASW